MDSILRVKWVAVFAGALLLAACGGGSSSSKDDNGTTPPPSGGTGANISEEGTIESLEWIDSTIPGCEVVDAGAVPLMMALSSPARFVIDRTGTAGGPSMLQAQSFDGDCGGSLAINDTHQSGVTTYSVTFDDFCFTDYSTEQPTQNIIKGDIEAKDIGTPTDFGPMISSATAKSSSLQIESDGKTIDMSFDVEHVYGNPATWEAEIPTQDNPDKTVIKSARIKYPQEGKDHSISNLEVETYETATEDMVVNVTSGSYGLTNGNVLQISTSQPMVMDYYGELKSGTVDLRGADGNVVQIKPSSSGTITISVNGENLDKALVCDGLPL